MKPIDKRMRADLILLFFFVLTQSLYSSPKFGIVSVPVLDVRAASGTVTISYDYSPLQETQLLYGEPVQIVAESGEWYRIEAPEQQEFSHNNRWQGYPGWVQKSSVHALMKLSPANFVVHRKMTKLFSKPDPTSSYLPLSLGTKVVGRKTMKGGFRQIEGIGRKIYWVPEEDIRSLVSDAGEEDRRRIILQSVRELLGDLYFWGGMSAHIPELENQVTAVDCSGLAHLAYQVAGLSIPRDSYEQYLKARKIKREELRAGDLIFSASKEKPEKVSHVALYVNESSLIEAPKTGETVREIEFEKKYGVPFKDVETGHVIGDRILYFGTYFGSQPNAE
ncbi:MAG: C40 family peptidase [Elusimicrobia bacterium]|nr:C40 family peptidase [Elusimicrobiota bacterium]